LYTDFDVQWGLVTTGKSARITRSNLGSLYPEFIRIDPNLSGKGDPFRYISKLPFSPYIYGCGSTLHKGLDIRKNTGLALVFWITKTT